MRTVTVTVSTVVGVNNETDTAVSLEPSDQILLSAHGIYGYTSMENEVYHLPQWVRENGLQLYQYDIEIPIFKE